MKKLLQLGFVLGLMCCQSGLLWASAPATDKPAYVIGTAYQPGTDRILYTETHYWLSKFLKLVEYNDANGEILVRKTVNFSRHKFTPDVLLEDYRLVRRASLMHGPQKSQHILEATDSKESIASTVHSIGSYQVTDAGINSYIQAHWKSLADGQQLKFHLTFIDQHDVTALVAESSACDEAEADTHCIAIRTDSVEKSDTALLVYTAANHKLERFVGEGMVRDTQGKRLHVDLRYQYQ